MSELSNRMAIERDFARKLSRLSTRQRQELLRIAGDPPDVTKVTDADWQRWQQEREAEMTVLLLAVWLRAANQHLGEVLPGDVKVSDDQHADLIRRGTAWAAGRAAETAASSIETARSVLTSSADVLRPAPEVKRLVGPAGELIVPAPRVIELPGPTAQRVIQLPGPEARRLTGPTPEQVNDILVRAMGPDRDAVTAATETTTAAVNGTGGIEPIVNDAGFALRRRWHTEKDGKVCPICRPLDGKWMEFVELVLQNVTAPGGTRAIDSIVQNGGPPAHPNCRCWIEVHAEPVAKRQRF